MTAFAAFDFFGIFGIMKALEVFVILNILLNISFVSGKNTQYVSCGSVLKLMNTASKVRLHSHDIKYGTGSGQQSVTGVEEREDINSHWVLKGPTGQMCTRGEPLKCGSVIRLEHLATNKNLHSHFFQSPLSGKQEISAYGENGEGDSGDHWKLMCDGKFWERNVEVSLQHADTDVYLAVSGKTYGRPISGQAEIVGETYLTSTARWITMEGLFIHKSDGSSRTIGHDPTEF